MEEAAQPVAEKPVMYRRKLDRSPSNDFDRLRKDEKILISRLRMALEEAKGRTVKLREENEAKDEIISKERREREVVEERLEKFLVDVYNNPKINSELRQRLPRARNYDPLHRDGDQNHPPDITEDLLAPNNDQFSEKVTTKLTDPFIQANVIQGTIQREDLPRALCISPSETIPSSVSQINQYTPLIENPLEAQAEPPYQYSYPLINKENYAQIYDNSSGHNLLPILKSPPSSIVTGLSSSFLDLPTAGQAHEDSDQVIKDKQIQSLYTVGVNETPPSKTGPDKEQEVKVQRDNPQTSDSHFTPQASMSAINYQLSQPYKPPSDNVSHITRFLAEISTLKKENEQLKNELAEKKHDLEMLKEEMMHVKEGGDGDDSVAALIEMVHSAGKTREKALAQMVSSAQQDRDAVLGELDRMRHKTSEKSLHTTSASNNDLTELEEADENHGAGYVSAEIEPEYLSETYAMDTDPSLEEMKILVARQRETMQEDMKEVLQQRDKALLKVDKLEKKLCAFELSEFSDRTIESLQSRLKIAETERDIALSKMRRISENFGEVKLLNNLRQALAVDSSQAKSKHSSKNKHTDGDKWDSMKNNNMTASLNKQIEDNNRLEKKIVLLEYRNKEQAQHIDKLQALVKRQRQKLNTLCAGPLLIDE